MQSLISGLVLTLGAYYFYFNGYRRMWRCRIRFSGGFRFSREVTLVFHNVIIFSSSPQYGNSKEIVYVKCTEYQYLLVF